MSVQVPPRWVRRVVIDPLFLAIGAWLLFAAIPALIIAVTVLSFVLPRSLRPLRVIGFALVYLTVQVFGVAACFLAWVASGFGWALRRPWCVELHYWILRAALGTLFWFGTRYFHLDVRRDGPPLPGDDGDPTTTELPLLVMSRHAGPGDSFLLVHELLSWAGRRPRIVLKHSLQWDPLIDVLFNRLPMRFVDPGSAHQDESLAAIGRLAATMEPRDAILIFPEGGNITEGRRLRAIERLRKSGRLDAADRAERIVHLMPPRTRGVLAALSANPELHAVIVSHTGLDQLDSLGDIWRELPLDKTLHLRWRITPASAIPQDSDGLSDWLFTQWEEMDRWVDRHRTSGTSTPAGPVPQTDGEGPARRVAQAEEPTIPPDSPTAGNSGVLDPSGDGSPPPGPGDERSPGQPPV